jgi:hypothetical protein
MVFRVSEPGKPAFRLRPGEEGISVFMPEAVEPPLNEDETIANFRPGSRAVVVPDIEVERLGLRLVPIRGGEPLPPRLREAHAEIRPGTTMTRREFKAALRELETYASEE